LRLLDSELLRQNLLDPLEDFFTRRCQIDSLLVWTGVERARSYSGRRTAFGQTGRQRADHVVLDASRGEVDRVRDRAPGRVAVGDHGEAAQAEQVRAAVRLGIERRAEAPRRRADQKPTELPAPAGRDLVAERVEHGPDRPLEQLQRDVAGE